MGEYPRMDKDGDMQFQAMEIQYTRRIENNVAHTQAKYAAQVEGFENWVHLYSQLLSDVSSF